MRGKALLTVFVLAFGVLATQTAWAQNGRSKCTQGSDNATWSAATSTFTSIVVGSTGDLGVNMTSPTCLNNYPTFPGSLSVYADVNLDDSVCPDGSSGSAATCTLIAPIASISDNPQQYSDFGKTDTYTVNFDATNATPGIYTFHVHANAADPNDQKLNQVLNGYGWGYGGGLDLTVVVVQPKPTCDPSDQLNVSFDSPSSGNVNFCNGGTKIPVSVRAYDTSNPVTSLLVSVNDGDITGSLTVAGLQTTHASASGNYMGGAVGTYAFEAYATTACTKNSAEATVSLIYVISGLQKPLADGSRAKGGSTAPIKFIPTDCSGALVPFDSSVHVMVYDSTHTNRLQDSFYGGCSGVKCGQGGDTTVRYDASSGQYIANFQTDAGANTYKVEILFGGVVNLATQFSTLK